MPGPIPRLVIRVKLRKNRETNDEEARPKRFDASPACPFNRSLYRLSLKRAYRARFLIGDSSLYLSVSRMPPPDKHITRVRRVPGKTQNEKKKTPAIRAGLVTRLRRMLFERGRSRARPSRPSSSITASLPNYTRLQRRRMTQRHLHQAPSAFRAVDQI